ncbi:MAG: cadmium-translocating P-type ATPase [Clostridium sp.]|nr:cadmium-translocating P-type ATPase [Clostridium sp.]
MLKKRLIRILAGAGVYIAAILIDIFAGINHWIVFGIFLAAFLIIGGDVIWKALRNIVRGRIFDENFLMLIATVGAFALQDYREGVAVMLFYQVGELFQSYAVNRSRKSISELMDIAPEFANVMRGGKLETVDPEEVEVGETIVVKPGEKIPLDGVVLEGTSFLDTSALTGESVPREVQPENSVLSGCINKTGALTIEVTKEFEDSTVAKILDLVENASSRKANAENFITKFARYYTPAVVIAAVLLAVIPPLFLGINSLDVWSEWVRRALTFLVISCPCALVISIPLGFFGGIGGASKWGVLVKGSNYLEALAKAEVVVFDKTGTLTKGTFQVTEVHPNGMKEEELLELTAYAEYHSNHPIATSIQTAYGKEIELERLGAVKEIAGHGIEAQIDGRTVYAGNAKLMELKQIPFEPAHVVGTIVYVAVEHQYAGYLLITDEVKEDAKEAIEKLKQLGIKKTVMLTGDRKSVAEQVANDLGIDEVYSDLLPADKVEQMERLFAEKSKKSKLVFVGDGINDAPVLARADIGIAMGALGSDAAIEAADIVIMNDKPSRIATVMGISRKTLNIVIQNISLAFIVKFAALILGAFGMATLWEAVFADVGVAVLAILNAIRALRYKEK